MSQRRLNHVEVAGAGPAVVLLHGQPGSADNWAAVVPLLRDRYLVVAPDRPGYGRNEEPAGGFAANARSLLEDLDALGVERAVLVAHSWAGGVALYLGVHRPERVLGLVLVSSVGPAERAGPLDRLLGRRPWGDILAALAFGAAGRALSFPGVRLVAGRRFPQQAQASLAALPLTRNHRATARSFTVEQRALIEELPALTPGLAELRLPVAVLTGGSDHVVRPGVGQRLAAAIPDARLTRVDDAGHLMVYDRPDAVASAVDEVFGRVGPASQDRESGAGL